MQARFRTRAVCVQRSHHQSFSADQPYGEMRSFFDRIDPTKRASALKEVLAAKPVHGCHLQALHNSAASSVVQHPVVRLKGWCVTTKAQDTSSVYHFTPSSAWHTP